MKKAAENRSLFFRSASIRQTAGASKQNYRRSGRRQEFPENDRAAWFALDEARARLVGAQVELLDRLAERVING